MNFRVLQQMDINPFKYHLFKEQKVQAQMLQNGGYYISLQMNLLVMLNLEPMMTLSHFALQQKVMEYQ